MSIYWECLKRATGEINSKMEQSKNIFHNGEKGTFREYIIKNVLRPFLPMCYGICGGECFDAYDERSKQLDIILYDALFSCKIPYTDDFAQFPIESVIGNIEIKSMLNEETFIESLNNISSAKKLKRDKADVFDYTPKFRVEILGSLRPENADMQKNNYLGIIFAYDSSEIKTVKEYFMNIEKYSKLHKNALDKEIIDNKNLLPDIIVLFSKKVIILRQKIEDDNTLKSINLDLDAMFNGYCFLKFGDNTIAFFITYLLLALNSTQLKGMNLLNIVQDNIMLSSDEARECVKF